MPRYSPTINVMISTIKKTTNHALRDFEELSNLQNSVMPPVEFARRSFSRTEEVLIRSLNKTDMGYGFISRSFTKVKEDAYNWVIDTSIGMENFLRSIPEFGISLSLRSKTEVVASVFYIPTLDEIYYVEKNSGVFTENRRCRTSKMNKVENAFVCTNQVNEALFKKFKTRYSTAPLMDMVFLADGKYDAILYKKSNNDHQLEAAKLFIKEASGVITNASGKDLTDSDEYVVMTNGAIHSDFVNKLSTLVHE